MELPFAVESTDMLSRTSLRQSESSSLVTASSQGSFMNSSNLDVPLPPNTPQDVVLPRYDNLHSASQRQRISGHVPTHTSRQQDPVDGYEEEVVDFTYVNVCETEADEVDILLEGGGLDSHKEANRGDVLAVLLSGVHQNMNSDSLLNHTEDANEAAQKAAEAKKRGNLVEALEYHRQAAKLYRDNAIAIRGRNASLANSMLLLSQTQAKSAMALKGIVKLNPVELRRFLPATSGGINTTNAPISHKERLRAAVRGALGSRHPHEEDISDSQFLGRAERGPASTAQAKANSESKTESEGVTLLVEGQESDHNPVDEMMELERELRDMDMALELGNSISSLDTRMQSRMKNSMVDGSFMVVPPGSNSYISSSMWDASHNTAPNTSRSTAQVKAPQTSNLGTAGVRARANRVQTMLEASAAPVSRHPSSNQLIPQGATKNAAGLESSWWGNASTTSQVLASSVISLGSRTGAEAVHVADVHCGNSANTKQLMRLMDSLKTLGDENAHLLREVEELEAARQEAKNARAEMKRFKVEYGKRFAALKAALEKFRQEHPQGKNTDANPVKSSEFMQTASVTDQLQKQEQLIRKLTADLKKEKEESKQKNAALRKYESFYREVKARSAQKAAQRQMESQQRNPKARQSASRVPR